MKSAVSVAEAFRVRDKNLSEWNDRLICILEDMQTKTIQQDKKIKELQDAIIDIILTRGD